MRCSVLTIINVLFVLLTILGSTETKLYSLHSQVQADESIVIPGVGCEKICLGDSLDEVRVRMKYAAVRVVQSNQQNNLITQVLKVAGCSLSLKYDSMHYLFHNNVVVLVLAGRVSGIISFNKRRVTFEGVSISKGAGQLVYHYGNSGLVKCGSAQHQLLIYPAHGMAIVDDNGDDVIDMIIVFPRQAVDKSLKAVD